MCNINKKPCAILFQLYYLQVQVNQSTNRPKSLYVMKSNAVPRLSALHMQLVLFLHCQGLILVKAPPSKGPM